MDLSPLNFELQDVGQFPALLEAIGELYQVREIGDEVISEQYMDSFDWRLFHDNLTLTRKRYQYHLATLAGKTLCIDTGSRKNNPLWWDFPEGELRELLRPSADIRALLVQFTVRRTFSSFALLNKDEKTVLRLRLVSGTAERDDEQFFLPVTLQLDPLRGYTKPLNRIVSIFEETGLKQVADGTNVVGNLHRIANIDPTENSGKFIAELDQDENVAQVVRDICQILKGTMVKNLQGTLDDIDSEYLHDFRVSIRRTRSLLSLMKEYLPLEEIRHFQQEFKWVGTVTGPVRDLDVYLLKTEAYREMLPEELQLGLEWFFKDLERQRKRALRNLRLHLNSDRFSSLLHDWGEWLEELPMRDDYPQGQLKCRKVAEKIIRKKFKRILKDGRAITPGTPDKNLHELRIEGKKFRYILEFYRSLFEASSVDRYLKQMKKLQNNLGDFNDFSVQREMLITRLEGLKTGDHSIEIAAALGGLIVHLGDFQDQVRRKFERTFKIFDTPENIALLESILGAPDVEGKLK